MLHNLKMYFFGRSVLPLSLAVLATTSLIVARFNREHPQFFWFLLIFAAILTLAECFVFTRFVRDIHVKLYEELKITPGPEWPNVIRLLNNYALLSNIKNVLVTIGWAICVSFSRSVLVLIPFFVFSIIIDIPIRRQINLANLYMRQAAGLLPVLFTLQ